MVPGRGPEGGECRRHLCSQVGLLVSLDSYMGWGPPNGDGVALIDNLLGESNDAYGPEYIQRPHPPAWNRPSTLYPGRASVF